MADKRTQRAEIAAVKKRRLITDRAHQRRHALPLPVSAPTTRAPAAVPRASARASQINPDYPIYGTPTTVTVRNNFAAAKKEIEDLQDEKLDLSGGMMTGLIFFADGQVFDGGTF
jgi:hypothetical protein